jgi:hypothetical protein
MKIGAGITSLLGLPIYKAPRIPSSLSVSKVTRLNGSNSYLRLKIGSSFATEDNPTDRPVFAVANSLPRNGEKDDQEVYNMRIKTSLFICLFFV